MSEIDIKVNDLYLQGRNFIFQIKVTKPIFSIKYIWDVLCEFIRLAENIINIPNCGATKHEIVMKLWNEANDEFKLTDKLTDFIPDKIKIWKFNLSLKWIDINAIIDKILIPAIVLMANKLGWGKNV